MTTLQAKMKRVEKRTLRPVAVLSLILTVWLGYFYLIDGTVLKKPIVFMNGVDPLNFELERSVYYAGETPKLRTAFCKTRKSSGTVEWTLIDGYKQAYPRSEPSEIAVGCYPDGGGTFLNPTRRIPSDWPDTCDAYFVGAGEVTLSGGRVIPYTYKTQKFCIKAI